MFKTTKKRLKLSIRFFVILIGISYLTSCSVNVYQPQESMVINVIDSKQAYILLSIIQEFANKNEYSYKTQAGNSDTLSQQGKFQVIFKNKIDNSFVSIDNILKKECVGIAVYSGKNGKEAKKVITQIEQKITSQINVNRKGKC